jgi:hypothetical protein
MTTFDEEFAAAFVDVLVEFGETTTYTPSVGSARTITAVITTGDVAPLAVSENAPAVRALVRVLADNENATYGGISASEVVKGRDTIAVVLRDGDAAVALTVMQVLDDSPGVTSLVAY